VREGKGKGKGKGRGKARVGEGKERKRREGKGRGWGVMQQAKRVKSEEGENWVDRVINKSENRRG